MKLSPRIIPGALSAINKSACDWNWQGLLAYGCHNFVVVLDSRTVQVLQTFHHYSAAIVRVRWARDSIQNDAQSPCTLKLAVADQAGHVMIWDVFKAEMLNEFPESGKPVQEMHWMHRTEAFAGCLMVLHSPGLLVLLNAETGVRLWRTSFHDSLISFALDPFDMHSMAVMSHEWVMFLHGLNTVSPPSEKSKKFYITSNASSTSGSGHGSGGALQTPSKSGGTSKSAFAKMMSWAGDMRGRNDEENLSSDCLQIAYSLANKGHFLLLFSREILILDLEFGQAVGSFSVEKNSPSFLQIVPCKYRDGFFCIHDNGSITFKIRRAPGSIPYSQSDTHVSGLLPPDIIYDAQCHSDVFRLSRLCRIMGFSICPRSEREVCLILSDGRVLFWEVACEPQVKTLDCIEEDCLLSLADMVPPLVQFNGTTGQKNVRKMKFQLTGMYQGVAPNPTCLKMCPPLTTKNWAVYKPLAAVGTSSGIIQVFNISDGSMYREVAVHSTAVKGMEWINLSIILSFAYSSSGSAKNEIQMIDICTGQTCVLPTSRGLQESFIACIKVSSHRQYFAVLFKNQRAELWDAVTMSQLREFPGNVPFITALEWGPSSYSSKLKKKVKPDAPAGSEADIVGNVFESDGQTERKKAYVKEHLVVTNNDGYYTHYVVDGTSMKDGSKVPPESGMSTINCLVWKGDYILSGDVNGNTNIWDIKLKKSNVFETNRGPVKRMKFAPGKGNMKLIILFEDGIVLWEGNGTSSNVTGLKTTKDQPGIRDADWLSSDMPLFLLSDGSVRVMDKAIKTSNSAIADKSLEEWIFLPRVLLPKAQMVLKNLLEHQSWNLQYDLEFSDIQESDILEYLEPAIQTIKNECSKRLINAKHGTAERCCIVSKIFGDECGYEFWTVALHYLRKEKGKRICTKHKNMDAANKRRSSYKDVVYADGTKGILRTDSQPGSSLPGLSDEELEDQKSPEKCTCLHSHLDSCYDILCDNDFYQTLQLYNIALRDGRRSTPEQSRTCAGKLILTGETDRAVQILLETDPNDASYYSDALRACLIATVRSSGASQSTIKLVATNLIANGKLSEGIELLCLVDKGVDACRYLQTYGQWNLATWLAKVSLVHEDFINIILRWAEHLSSSHMNQKSKALMVVLSIGDFPKALEIMYSLGQISRAVLLLESCFEFELLSPHEEQHRNLFENIFVAYARHLHTLGLNKAVGYYCTKAGGRGRKLLEELNSLSGDLSIENIDSSVGKNVDENRQNFTIDCKDTEAL